MGRDGWHFVSDVVELTLSRRVPVRFDVMAQTAFPLARRGRLARAVRQDLWRMLQGLRGFSPVVRVIRDVDHLCLQVGGGVEGRFPRGHVEAQLAQMLADPMHRARWIAYAGGAA